MSKSTKKWLVAAAFLVVIGAMMFAAVMTEYHWEFSSLSTDSFETNTYEISEGFNGIKLDTATADIIFIASDDDTCRVVCHEEEKVKHSVGVKDDMLIISAVDGREWYEYIGVSFDSPRITVCLPDTEYKTLVIKESTGRVEIPGSFSFDEAEISSSTGDIIDSASVRGLFSIKTSTGDVRVDNASVGKLDITVSTGDVTVTGVVSDSISSSGSTGDISLNDVIVTGNISVERSTGDVRFDDSDAAEISVKTSTGSVSGSLLSEKVFAVETHTGSISVPVTSSGGKCEIITSTGDIKMEVSGGNDQ